ncbi:Protein of unknown function [Thermanaeromonas toyohensis ToBE]|uniref:DUF4446 domain-containing protein n=1 Tax=Thermanaeromonas toyohensis ToBE TaxID=698762 RepID=A0A1W1W3H3_9FIRM|nr:DUF4446 family protein [Thermanaeromonas toyohensis]SMC00178.1 Protein of unknown function [Thermanaeromonas toyohensis ToBE]
MLADINYWMRFMLPYVPHLSIVTLVVGVILLMIMFHTLGEIRRLDRRLRRLAGVGEIEDLSNVLERFRDLKEVRDRIEHLEEKVSDILHSLESTLCRVGLVRFNAFPDTGSELSFALAVLSKEGDGFILTSLYSREETRVFLKPVKRGRALYRISEEEEKALHIALGYLTPEREK